MQSLKQIPFILFLFLITSCGRYKDISVGDFSEYKVKGFQDNALVISVKVAVENPSIHKITISDLDARMFVNDEYIGKVFTDQQVILKSRSAEIHELEFKVRVANLLVSTSSLLRLKRGDKIKLRMEGSFIARSMLVKRKVEVDETREVVF